MSQNKQQNSEAINTSMLDDEEEEGGIRIGDIYLPPPPPPACTFDSSGPRLVITHIENDYFKSYAGKQVLGPFHKSFTSIVGPNGSGKSNVIDSMLFVFGYRAQKIRSKKISVLIHNSETHPNVQSCTVAVHFRKIIDKGEDLEVVPNTEFVVSRTAFKDNSSYYQVNGKKCQFKVVAKLLRGHGIDLDHNRFLILQGEVEQIAMMKPIAQNEHDTGMLEYLEDIIGSSRFKEPIDLLSKRVEELNEQRTEKLNRVKLVEKEKDELEQPKNEAIAHLKQENEVTIKKNMLFQRFMLDANEDKEQAEIKKQEIDDGMADMKKKLEDLSEKKKKEENEMRKRAKILESVVKEKDDYSEKFKALESEDAKLQEELKHKNQKRKKLKAQIISETKKLEELESVPEKNMQDIEECEKRKSELEATRKKKEEVYHKAMDSLNSETQQLQEEKKVFETKLIGLQEAVDEKKSALDIAQSELDIYQSTAKKEEKLLEQYKLSLEKAVNLGSTRTDEVKKLKKAIPETEKEISSKQRELKALTPTLENLEDQLKNSRAKLEETRSAMQSTSSRSKVLDALMKQKQSGEICGIFGRLGDLGGIDAKYDVAISTACGPLDNVVVDTVETGQQCINFLKKYNVGTCTFIALDKMQRWKANTESTIDTPENVPRLFDLVKVKDDRVKTAFYFALRDTLVATDLDQASRIAYGRNRHRVVTLKGELIEPSGTMSGGGRTALRGRMGKAASVVNIDPKEVAATEEQVEQLTSKAGQMRRQKSELEDSVQSLFRELNIMKTNLAKYEKDIQGSEEQVKVLQVQTKEQKIKVANSQPDPKKVMSLENDIKSKMKLFEHASSDAAKVESDVNRVHAQIVEITGGKTKKIKTSLQETNKDLEKIKAEITRLQVAIKTSKRNFSKLTEKIAAMSQEVNEAESELLSFSKKKKEIEENASEYLKVFEEKVAEESDLTTELQQLKMKFDEVVKEENVIKSEKIEIDQEIQKWEAMIKEAKGKLHHWKKQLNRLELVEIPSEEENDECTDTLGEVDAAKLKEIDAKQLQNQISVTEEKLSQAKPNLAVLQEYQKKEAIYLKRVAELEEITSQREEQRRYHEDLRKQRLNEFMSGFTIISNKLKEMYQMITLGGDAELELVDSLDPFSEGIVFSVRPPKKSWKDITNLSGGEKTLSSLALVFALHYYKPTPLYVMDEIDAALDFKNVSIVGNYIKERTKNAQFIIISLRSQMFELADHLVGIFKTFNCTKSVTINPSKYGTKTEQCAPNQTVVM